MKFITKAAYLEKLNLTIAKIEKDEEMVISHPRLRIFNFIEITYFFKV